MMGNTYTYTHAKRSKSGKSKKSPERLNAEKGKFDFKEINGFQLKEVEWKVPSDSVRKRRRRAFGAVRKEFLKNIGATMEPELRAMGLKDAQIDMVKKGNAPNGYNVHHKLPIHGGGENVFSNLILMPIPPHDELHHKVMDPQVAQMRAGDSKKVMIPWTDDMVYRPPSKDQARENMALASKVMSKRGR